MGSDPLNTDLVLIAPPPHVKNICTQLTTHERWQDLLAEIQTGGGMCAGLPAIAEIQISI